MIDAITFADLMQALIGLGTLIGVYINLNTKITKLEAQVEHNRKTIEKMDNIIYNELKEIKDMLSEMKTELAVQKTKIEKDETK